MSILVPFTGAPSMTTEKYDATMPALEATGEFPPDGSRFMPPSPLAELPRQ